MTIARRTLLIALSVGAVAGGAAVIGARLGVPSGAPLGTLVIATILGAAAVALLTWPIARGLQSRLVAFTDALSAEGSLDAVQELPAPVWLSPLTSALADALERAGAEGRNAAARMREMELRSKVGELERRRIEATLDRLADAVIVTDTFDELIVANEAAAGLFGFERHAASHEPLASLVHEDAILSMVRQTRESGHVHERKSMEYDIHLPGAVKGPMAIRSYDITIACLPDARPDAVGGVVTILRDVTREKEISQLKSDFVSQVSHELRTPLASINAYVEMLCDGEAKDEASREEFYQVIKNEADRLGRLIDNMLNISRIEAGIIQVERTEVDFVQVAREVVEVMQPQARLKNITLITKPGPLVYTAQASRDMMHQVMLNLVSNAVKYTPENGRVTVAIENDDTTRSVLVAIADTGLGIPPDSLPRVFEKFYRIENYKRVAKGTGLGLNLCKHIVETVHGGAIGVDSTVGMGSRFWFTIPFEAAGKALAA